MLLGKMEGKKEKIRPYWRVDLKWIIALIFIPILATTMLILGFYLMTERDNAINISATLLQSMYTSGQNSDQNVAAIREKIESSPGKVLKPFPGTDIQITEADLNKYSANELTQNLFRQLATVIYDGNSNLNSGSLKDSTSKLGAMAIFTKSSHAFLGQILLYGFLISLLFLAFLVYFSWGFGRLVSPGIISLIVGLPALLATTILQHQQSTVSFKSGNLSFSQLAQSVVATIGPTIAAPLEKVYLVLTLAGVLLLLAAIVGKIISKILKREKKI